METIHTVSILISIIFVSIAIGIFIGIKITNIRGQIHGVIRLAYDPDNPDHPAMGLMLESMDYILTHKKMVVGIEKRGFPDQSA